MKNKSSDNDKTLTKAYEEYMEGFCDAADKHDEIIKGIVDKEWLVVKGEHEGETYKVTNVEFHPYVGSYHILQKLKKSSHTMN